MADYDRALIAVVADEHYVQTARTLEDHDVGGNLERVLESEFAWIHLPALQETIGVRDVLRVDGQAVADGSRLHALLEHPPQDASREIRAILAESARHNVGALERNFNFPTFPLVYLRRSDDSRTRWRADSDGVATRCASRSDSTPRSCVRFTGRPHAPAAGSSWTPPAAGFFDARFASSCLARAAHPPRSTESGSNSSMTGASISGCPC